MGDAWYDVGNLARIKGTNDGRRIHWYIVRQFGGISSQIGFRGQFHFLIRQQFEA